MINPNIYKRLTVEVFGCLFFKYNSPYATESDNDYLCSYKGQVYTIDNRSNRPIKPGNRHVNLKFSIMSDRFYLVK